MNENQLQRLNGLGSEAAVVMSVIEMFLGMGSKEPEQSIDAKQVWAVESVLAMYAYEPLVDLTLEMIEEKRKDFFTAMHMAQIALVGASREWLEKLVPRVISGNWFGTAEKLVRQIGREFTPEEVRMIGKAYCDTESNLRDLAMEDSIEEIFSRVLGTVGPVEFQSAVEKRWAVA